MTPCKLFSVLLFAALASSSGCMMNSLPHAAETGNSALLNQLLSQGIAVDQRGGSMDETALLVSARHGNLGMVRTLLDAGADIDARSKYNDTGLTAATAFCHADVALFLIERGADVNAKNSSYGSTPLILATECNDADVVRALIKGKANVNDINKQGATALTAAAVKGRVQIAETLLAAGADINRSGTKVESPLFEAAQQGGDAMVKLLLDKGAEVNYRSIRNDWTPLMIAVAEKHESTSVLLIKAGADVNLPNEKGRTALMFAAIYGSVPITDLLLRNGANPNVVPSDNEGKTALMAAASKGYKEVVELLLKYNADPNLRNKRNQTALSYAQGETKQLLKAAGGTL